MPKTRDIDYVSESLRSIGIPEHIISGREDFGSQSVLKNLVDVEKEGIQNFGAQAYKSLVPGTVSAFQNLVGNYEGGKETMRRAEERFPTRPDTQVSTFLGNAIGSSIPSLPAIAMPQLSVPILAYYGLMGAGQGREVVRDIEAQTGKDISIGAELLTAVGYGVTQTATELWGLGSLKRLATEMPEAIAKEIGEAYAKGETRRAANLILKHAASTVPKAAVVGFQEEGTSQLLTNAIDMVHDEGKRSAKGLFENVPLSALGGAVGEGLFPFPSAMHRGYQVRNQVAEDLTTGVRPEPTLEAADQKPSELPIKFEAPLAHQIETLRALREQNPDAGVKESFPEGWDANDAAWYLQTVVNKLSGKDDTDDDGDDGSDGGGVAVEVPQEPKANREARRQSLLEGLESEPEQRQVDAEAFIAQAQRSAGGAAQRGGLRADTQAKSALEDGLREATQGTKEKTAPPERTGVPEVDWARSVFERTGAYPSKKALQRKFRVDADTARWILSEASGKSWEEVRGPIQQQPVQPEAPAAPEPEAEVPPVAPPVVEGKPVVAPEQPSAKDEGQGEAKKPEPRVSEMTRSEFRDYILEKNPLEYVNLKDWLDAHKQAVEKALSEGKPVPRNVLEDYRGEPWADDALAKLEAQGSNATEIAESTHKDFFPWQMKDGDVAQTGKGNQYLFKTYDKLKDAKEAERRLKEVGGIPANVTPWIAKPEGSAKKPKSKYSVIVPNISRGLKEQLDGVRSKWYPAQSSVESQGSNATPVVEQNPGQGETQEPKTMAEALQNPTWIRENRNKWIALFAKSTQDKGEYDDGFRLIENEDGTFQIEQRLGDKWIRPHAPSTDLRTLMLRGGMPNTLDAAERFRVESAGDPFAKKPPEVQQKPEGKPLQPVAEGMEHESKVSDKEKVKTRFAVVELDDLIASHDAGLQKNPNYPQELQRRDRGRAATEGQLVSIISNFDPQEITEPSYNASEGTPIVGQDSVVESGNGRTIALMRIYQYAPEVRDKYTAYLKENAARFGLKPEDIGKAKKPVLVRIRTSEVANRADYAEALNNPRTAQMSAAEQAARDVEHIDESMVKVFSPNENGEIDTQANREFVRGFMDRIPEGERGKMLNAEGGLSADGKKRIKNAIFGKAYGVNDLLTQLTDSADTNIQNVVNGMVRSIPSVVRFDARQKDGSRYPLGISRDISAAAQKLSALRERGVSVAEYLKQNTIYDEQIGDEAGLLLLAFDKYKRSGKAIGELLNLYYYHADKFGSPGQDSFLGDNSIPSRKELLAAVLEEFDDGGTGGVQAPGLFDQPERSGAEDKGKNQEGPGGQGTKASVFRSKSGQEVGLEDLQSAANKAATEILGKAAPAVEIEVSDEIGTITPEEAAIYRSAGVEAGQPKYGQADTGTLKITLYRGASLETAIHEIGHALLELDRQAKAKDGKGLFNEAQRRAIEKEFRGDEEAFVQGLAEYATGKRKATGILKAAFDRAMRFMREMASKLGLADLKIEDVFEAILRGETAPTFSIGAKGGQSHLRYSTSEPGQEEYPDEYKIPEKKIKQMSPAIRWILDARTQLAKFFGETGAAGVVKLDDAYSDIRAFIAKGAGSVRRGLRANAKADSIKINSILNWRQNKAKLNEWLTQIRDARESENIEGLTDAQKAFNEVLNKVFDDVAARAAEVGYVLDDGFLAGVHKIRGGWAKFFPWIMDPKIAEELRDGKKERLQQLEDFYVQMGMSRESAAKEAKGFYKDHYATYFAGIEKPRTAKIPPEWRDPDIIRAIERYITLAESRIAEMRHFGQPEAQRHVLTQMLDQMPENFTEYKERLAKRYFKEHPDATQEEAKDWVEERDENGLPRYMRQWYGQWVRLVEMGKRIAAEDRPQIIQRIIDNWEADPTPPNLNRTRQNGLELWTDLRKAARKELAEKYQNNALQVYLQAIQEHGGQPAMKKFESLYMSVFGRPNQFSDILRKLNYYDGNWQMISKVVNGLNQFLQLLQVGRVPASVGGGWQGLLRSMKATRMQWSDEDARSFVENMGVIQESLYDIVTDINVFESGRTRKLARGLAKWSGITPIDSFGRRVQAQASLLYAQECLGGNLNARERNIRKRWLKRWGVDLDAVEKRGHFTPGELRHIAQRSVAWTQASNNPLDMPFFAQGAWGKIAMRLKRFSYNEARFAYGMLDEFRKGNPMPFLTYLSTLFAGGELYALLKRLILGEEDQNRSWTEIGQDVAVGEALLRFVDRMAAAGGFGLLFDALPPAQLARSWLGAEEGEKAVGFTETTAYYAERMIKPPVVGTLINAKEFLVDAVKGMTSDENRVQEVSNALDEWVQKEWVLYGRINKSIQNRDPEYLKEEYLKTALKRASAATGRDRGEAKKGQKRRHELLKRRLETMGHTVPSPAPDTRNRRDQTQGFSGFEGFM